MEDQPRAIQRLELLINREIARVDSDIQAMCEAMRDGFNETYARMDKRFDQVDRRLDQMDERFDRMDDRMLRLELNMENWRSDCRAFTEGWRANSSRLDDVEARVDGLEQAS